MRFDTKICSAESCSKFKDVQPERPNQREHYSTFVIVFKFRISELVVSQIEFLDQSNFKFCLKRSNNFEYMFQLQYCTLHEKRAER